MTTDYELVRLAETISNLTLEESFKLMNILNNEHGIRIINWANEKPIESAYVGDCLDDVCMDEYSSNKKFKVFLRKVGPYKLAVVKAIKDITGLGLRESKEIADKVDAGPSLVKEISERSEAEYIKHELESQGATVEIK
jgi:large subunit ribosomal protein L7/L12